MVENYGRFLVNTASCVVVYTDICAVVMSYSVFESADFKLRQFTLKLKKALNYTKRCRHEDTKTRDEIVNETRALAQDYIDDRLIRSGLHLKQRKISQSTAKLGNKDDHAILSSRLNIVIKAEKVASNEAIQIMSEKRHSPQGCLLTIDDLSKVLMYVGEALETRHPTIYTDVLQQLNIRSLTEVNLHRIFMSVARELFSEDANWPKIVSFFAFAGGLAVDCVLNGSSVYVSCIKNWTVEFIDNDLVDWIIFRGGWVSSKLKTNSLFREMKTFKRFF